jgi:hypothetical protein
MSARGFGFARFLSTNGCSLGGFDQWTGDPSPPNWS